MPASTAPTPPGASGNRLATMPTKKPWTTTPRAGPRRRRRGSSPRGSPMLAAQKPIAPATARPPRRGWRTKAIAVRVPWARVAGTSPAAARSAPKPPRGASRDPPLEVLGQQRHQQTRSTIATPAIAAGTIVARERRSPGEHAGAQQDPEDDQRQQVDRVEEDQEGDHPAGRLAPLHPRLAQRPVGEHDPAGAAGREQPRRRQPRHRDLVALAATRGG